MNGEYELYHYGVKGMKWGVRRNLRKQQALSNKAYRKASYYTSKSEKAKMKGDSAKYEKYQSKAWKEVAKIAVAQQKIKDMDPRSIDAGKKFVSTISNTRNTTSGKTPYHAKSEQERNRIDSNYQNQRKKLVAQFRNATTESEKQRIMAKVDKLENDYLDMVERD